MKKLEEATAPMTDPRLRHRLLGKSQSLIAIAVLSFALAGCGSRTDSVLSPFGGESSASSAGTADSSRAGGGLALGTGDFTPGGVTFGTDTGTAVGQRVGELQSELGQLQSGIGNQNAQLQQIRTASITTAQNYFGLVAAINARLQVGTTPGNPILVQQYAEAQAELEQFGSTITDMNGLASNVAASSASAAFILESVRATYGLTGAVDEDHRNLNILEDEVNRTVVLIDRLLNELSEDLSRQTTYLNTERQNLQALQVAINNGELYGLSLANRAYVSSVPQLASAARTPEPTSIGAATGQRPLVVIRFTSDDVDYEQPLYQAVSAALERRPQAVFDIVAVSPSEGGDATRALAANQSRRNAEGVLRTLVDLGLPPNQATLSSAAADVSGSEVHVYVR